MAKNFPFFKFFPTEWITGNINYEDYSVQGLFIGICALYWQRDGKVSIDDLNIRFKKTEDLPKLTDRYFKVNNEGFISIKFLDEQLAQANHISIKNKENGMNGGRPKGSKNKEKKPTGFSDKNDIKAKKSKEEEEKEINKNNIGERKLKFADTLKPFMEKYGRDMVNDFYKYWTEPTKSGNKMRYDLQKTWDVSRRLETWSKNNFGNKADFKKESTSNQLKLGRHDS